MLHGPRHPSWKSISVSKLKEVLSGLPDDWSVETNDVGNLVVYDGEKPPFRLRGYIDLASEEYEKFSEELTGPIT
jgi:hypothetical protein